VTPKRRLLVPSDDGLRWFDCWSELSDCGTDSVHVIDFDRCPFIPTNHVT